MDGGERAWLEYQRYMLETGQWMLDPYIEDRQPAPRSPYTLDEAVAVKNGQTLSPMRPDSDLNSWERHQALLHDFLSRHPAASDRWTVEDPSGRRWSRRLPEHPDPLPDPLGVDDLVRSVWLTARGPARGKGERREGRYRSSTYKGAWQIWAMNAPHFRAPDGRRPRSAFSVWLTADGQLQAFEGGNNWEFSIEHATDPALRLMERTPIDSLTRSPVESLNLPALVLLLVGYLPVAPPG